MDYFLSIIAVIIACLVVIFGMIFLAMLEMYFQIKRYNKRHKGQFDERTNLWTMSKRYQDWYVENFANMKEGYYDEENKTN